MLIYEKAEDVQRLELYEHLSEADLRLKHSAMREQAPSSASISRQSADSLSVLNRTCRNLKTSAL